MNEFLELTFRSFWHFIGMTILLNGAAYFIFNFILRMYNRTLRYFIIKKYGYPPEHCDADGDFKTTDTEIDN